MSRDVIITYLRHKSFGEVHATLQHVTLDKDASFQSYCQHLMTDGYHTTIKTVGGNNRKFWIAPSAILSVAQAEEPNSHTYREKVT